MPLKNIELSHGGRSDTFVWRIVIPSNKKEAWRPKLCWVNKKPFTVGERLYFYHIEELIAVAKKYKRYGDFDNDVFSFIYEGENIRHYCR